MTKQEIIKRLNVLPKGGLTVKTIKGKNGKNYSYTVLQWNENGQQKSKTIKQEDVDYLKEQLEERKKLEQKLERSDFSDDSTIEFKTHVITGRTLKNLVDFVKIWKKRYCYKDVTDYIYGNDFGKVMILYGLRRTGKSTIIKQVISEMSDEDFRKAAYIQIFPEDNLSALNKDLKKLEENGYKYIFVDEVTFLEDFIEGAALLSDIYASIGMKIVLTGTDSLGFYLAGKNELYDRCRMVHTTFISYKEFEEVLGVHGIDNYIQYGGTMCISGSHYNDCVFNSRKRTDEYVDSAIANNIQHSLKSYQYGGHFRHLRTLSENNELTNVINRVVEDMNHRFALDVIERNFKSSDLRISTANSEKGKIDQGHVYEIEEYLEALDLIEKIDIKNTDLSTDNEERTIFTQPGLRYSQAVSFVETYFDNKSYNDVSAKEKQVVKERILSEIKGRMTEDIILLETKNAKPDKKVFKLQFSDGEFDMVINDPKTLETEIYEIKHSDKTSEQQTRHLTDEKKCDITEFRYGKITKKVVLYRGKTCMFNDIHYINVEEYLSDI